MDMHNSLVRTMPRSIHVFGALIVLLSCTLASAAAKDDWLEKGEGLLRSLAAGKSVQTSLTTGEIDAGLREALRVGTTTVVNQLGRSDGFYADPTVHIPLPRNLRKAKSTLQKVGMSSALDDLEKRLNRAAEVATPKAKELFWRAIGEMTLDDVHTIYKGPDDAATRYFQGKMSRPLAEAMRPIVDDSLREVGAIQAYENAVGRYRALSFIPNVREELTNHVIQKGMDGIFYYLAREEAQIRKNPAKRTTELLKRVFSAT